MKTIPLKLWINGLPMSITEPEKLRVKLFVIVRPIGIKTLQPIFIIFQRRLNLFYSHRSNDVEKSCIAIQQISNTIPENKFVPV